MNKAALYFFFDAEGIADEYNFVLLCDLKKNLDKLYVVVNGNLTEDSRRKFEAIADNVFIRENKGLDVWAYKEGIELIGWDVVKSFDEFIMMNFTNYGPVYPFAEMFTEMDKRDVDFWGITKHHGHEDDPYHLCEYGYIPAHIQSSFIAVRKKMLNSSDFRKYWDTMPMIEGYVDSICRHEAVFTEKFTRAGYTSDVYINTDDLKDVCDYPLMLMPLELVRNRRCPIFKRKTFYNIYEEYMDITCGQPAMEFYEFLRRETDFNLDIIWDNLCRTTNMWDVKQRMQLNFVLSRDYEIPRTKQSRIALFMHIHYPEMISELISYAANMPESADIFITTNAEEKRLLLQQKTVALPHKVTIVVVQNRGREYAGFLIGLKEYVKEYDYICIAHGKKSRYEKPYIIGDSFAYHCFENTLSTRAYINNVIHTFESNPRLGLLVPPTPEHAAYFATIGREWHSNYLQVVELLKKWNFKAVLSQEKPPVAPLGNFLWFRSKAMQKLFELNFSYEDFPEEPCSANDGTIMHALERIYSFVAQDAGYYSGWVMSDKYAAMRMTSEYKTIRDINEFIFHVGGETHRHGELYLLLQALEALKTYNGLGRKYLLKELIRRTVSPKCWELMRKVKNKIKGVWSL